MSSSPSPAIQFLGRVAYEMHQMKPLLPTYIHLLVSAIFPIYTAAHASLARPSSAAPVKKKKNADINELQDEEISPTIETLTPSDAILFPILAGATLASLYFILKWLQDPALLNYYLGLYFAFVGLYFQIKFVKDALATVRSFILPNQYSYRGKLWKVESEERQFVAQDGSVNVDVQTSPLPGLFSAFPQHRPSLWRFRRFVYTRLHLKFKIWKIVNLVTIIDTLDVASVVIAVPLVLYHTFIDKPWFLTNLLGFSFCYGSLQITTPGTSWTGTLLLSALFFYDIYFVFFTPMMVTVATKLDVPIKLLFPRPDGCIRPVGVAEDSQAMEEYLQCLAQKRTMAMLGLGDIVIPGMMLAFALRFDLYLFYRKLSVLTNASTSDGTTSSNKAPYLPATGSWGERVWTKTKLHSPELQAKRFPKTYFNASVIGYLLGMIATVVVMQVSQHAQPALLYLVPGVLVSLWSVAVVKGDFKLLWNYSEVPEEEKPKNSDKNNKKNGKKEAKDGEKQSDEIEAKKEKDNQTAETTTADEEKQDKDSDPTDSDDTKPKDTSTSLNENHIIYFSLSLIQTTKHKPSTKTQPDTIEVTERESSPKPITSSPSVPVPDSEDSYDWSSEDDEAEAEVKNEANREGRYGLRSSKSEKIGKSSGAGIAEVGDGEPVVKRRRKV